MPRSGAGASAAIAASASPRSSGSSCANSSSSSGRAGGLPFDRDKLMRSVQIALRKRPVDGERIERFVSGIVRRLESMGESEVASDAIGHLVMEGLRGIDDVGFVRFASVYKNFREVKDFEEFIDNLSDDLDDLDPALVGAGKSDA